MKKYFSILSYIYLLMFLPQFICSSVIGANYMMPLYIICYSLSVLIIVTFIFKNNILAEKKNIKNAIIYFVLLSFTFISDIILGVNINQNDFFDMIIKVVNIILFASFLPNMNFTYSDCKPFFSLIYYMGIVSCIYNLLKNYSIVLSFYNFNNSYDINLSSFFANRNTYGMFLFVAIICCMFLIKFVNKNKKKKIYYCGLILLIFNLILTMSRGSLIATALFLFFNYLYNSEKSKKTILKYMLFCILCIAIIIAILRAHPEIYAFILKFFVRANVGTTGRSELWQKGFDIALQHNIFNGVGFYTGLAFTNGDIQFHSFFIDNLVDAGILGLIFKIYMIVKSYKSIKNTDKKLNNFYKSAYIALLFLCFFESVNFFSLGFAEAQFTLIFITIPLVFGKSKIENEVVK